MAAWSTYMSDTQYDVLHRALTDDPEFSWTACTVRTLQSMKKRGWLELEFGPTTTPRGRTVRGVAGALVTNAGRHAYATVARMRAEVMVEARPAPAAECPLLVALVSSADNQLAARIDAAFGF